jgi:hypothetical protein
VPIVVHCEPCGAKLRLPDGVTASAVRCPKCKAVVKIPTAPAPAPEAPVARTEEDAPRKAAPAKEAPNRPARARDEEDTPKARARARDEADLRDDDDADEEDGKARSAAKTNKGKEKEAGKKKRRPADEDELEPLGDDPFEGLDIPEPMQDEILHTLTKKEKVLWVGRPLMKLMMRQARIAVLISPIILAIGLGAIGFGIYAFVGMKAELAWVGGLVGCLFGVIFSLAGVACIFAPTLTRRHAPHRAVYLVTNRRAIVFAGKGSPDGVRSYTGRHLENMERNESSAVDGAGDLVFEYEYETVHSGGGGHNRPGDSHVRKRPIGFLMIGKVHAVEKLLRETLLEKLDD